MNQLKSVKAPSGCGIDAEMLKEGDSPPFCGHPVVFAFVACGFHTVIFLFTTLLAVCGFICRMNAA